MAERDPRHLDRLETVSPTMAKADLKKVETDWRCEIGRAVQRAFALAGLSQKEAAAQLDRDPAQIARWISGHERPQLDALFSVGIIRLHFLIALAELLGEAVELETVIRIKRVA